MFYSKAYSCNNFWLISDRSYCIHKMCEIVNLIFKQMTYRVAFVLVFKQMTYCMTLMLWSFYAKIICMLNEVIICLSVTVNVPQTKSLAITVHTVIDGRKFTVTLLTSFYS